MPTPPPLRLAWASDIHLDHAGPDRVMGFCAKVRAAGASALLLGGDISTASRLGDDLATLAEAIDLPIHFVLGNHDHYGGSVAGVRAQVETLEHPTLDFLEGHGWRELAPEVGLVGEGGWGDARHGTFHESDVILNDYLMIEELRAVFDIRGCDGTLHGQDDLERALQALGAASAARLQPALDEAAAACRQVLILTHVPPFPAAALYNGTPSLPAWQPGFVCGALGEVIAATAAAHPQTTFTVLCGHTHGGGTAPIAPNVASHIQAAAYGFPDFQLVTGGADGLGILDPD